MVQDADRHSLLEEAIDKSTEGFEVSSERLLPLISRMTENGVSREGAKTALEKSSIKDAGNLSKIYVTYRNLMIERGVLDFPGLIAEAMTLLHSHEGVRKQIQRVYPYISVDEFQDTNLIQYNILRMLVNPTTRNLFVVADDDQIIYQWNGASPERLWALRKDFNMELLQLPQNYRCPPQVVALANKLIVHNFGRSPEKAALTAHKPMGGASAVTLTKFENFAQEAQSVSQHIASRSQSERQRTVVLARTKKLLEQMVDALTAEGVDAYLAVKKDEFESAPLQWLHSILRLANSRASRESLRRVCKSFYTLEGIDLNVNDVISRSSTLEGDYLRGWAQAALNRDQLSPDTRAMIQTAIPKLADRLDFWGFEKDAFKWLENLPGTSPDSAATFDQYKPEKETWEGLVKEICLQFGKSEVTLHLLLQELDLRSKSPPAPDGSVPCFTIHASKGMEFDYVYLVGMVEDQLPSWAAIKKGPESREMQEERRNCFVAITRTQVSLNFSYSDRVQGYPKLPSRFLREMGLLS